MTGYRSVAIFVLVLIYSSELVVAMPVDSSVIAPSAGELYSEAPCELHPLSAYKDYLGNIWGVGDDNLWWFNATNLSWSLLPMPNGTASSDPWRVACADPKRYVALIGRDAALVLHLPWQTWQSVTTDEVGYKAHMDKDVMWCAFDDLFAIDPQRKTFYELKPEDGHWEQRSTLPSHPYVNWKYPDGLILSWVGYDDELVMVEDYGRALRFILGNLSSNSWVVSDATDFPHQVRPYLNQSSEGRFLTMKFTYGLLWLWKEDKGVTQLWSFDYNLTTWRRGDKDFTSKLPPLDTVLAGWEEEDKYCVLKRSVKCTSQYGVSSTECWWESDMTGDNKETSSRKNDLPARSTITSAPTGQPKRKVAPKPKPIKGCPSTTAVVMPTTTTVIPTTIVVTPSPSTSLLEPQSPMKKPGITKHQPDTSWKINEKDVSAVSIIPAKNSNWHQHTSVFGSVIFFGTSITIFAIFGLFWCVRKCVHFPKEALLLRDPPSVRYTAIPDSLTYDSRRPTPATYTVIPDSIA